MLNVRMGKIDVIPHISYREIGNLIENYLQFCHNEREVTSHICFKRSCQEFATKFTEVLLVSIEGCPVMIILHWLRRHS